MEISLFSPKSLDVLAAKFGTDKSHLTHNFAQFYESFFSKWRNEPIKLLEIGVGRGSSLRMWRRFFRRGTLFAIESESRRKRYSFYGAKIFIGLQQDREFLKTVMKEIGPVDIIIDDGSHHVRDQQITLGTIFPHLKEGGYYVIEDLHTSLSQDKSVFGVDADGENSAYRMLLEYQNTKAFSSPYIPEEESNYLNAWVKDCHFYSFEDPSKHLTSILEKKQPL